MFPLILLFAVGHLLPGIVAKVKDGDRVLLFLLNVPVLVVEVSKPLGRLGGLVICRSSGEQLAERFEEHLYIGTDALAGFRRVLSALLSAPVLMYSMISSSEPLDSLSESTGDFGDSCISLDTSQQYQEKTSGFNNDKFINLRKVKLT